MQQEPTDPQPQPPDTSYNRYSAKNNNRKKQVSSDAAAIFIPPPADIRYVPVYELSVTDVARIAQKSEVYIRKIAREKQVGRITPRGYLFDHTATTQLMAILEESAKRRVGKRGELLPFEQNVCWVLLKQVEVLRVRFEQIQKERSRDHLMFYEVFQTLMSWKDTVDAKLKELMRGTRGKQ